MFRLAAGLGWVLTVLALAGPQVRAEVKFAKHEIGRVGDQMGQTSLVDVDKDGDLDWVVGANGGTVWWFEYQGPDRWVRHILGERVGTEVGGMAFDIDGDGWVDQVSGFTWFRNTGRPREQPFERYENGAIPRSHDNVAADVDRDGRLDVVMMSDRAGLFWYRIPADPKAAWEAYRIGPGVHGGIAPRGVGDIDGDGDLDVVRSNAWFENADGKGGAWVEHANIDFGRPGGSMPLTTRAWILDVNKDGRNDVVIVECDTPECRAAWFENADGKGGTWPRHLIAEKKGDLHSLCVADFDGDGDPDVFCCEGPLSGSGPGGARRWFLWENLDGKGGQWREQMVLEGEEGHETVAADVDGDGDIDVCTKPWKGEVHVYLENLAKPARR